MIRESFYTDGQEAGIWGLRAITKGLEKGKCPIRIGNKGAKPILPNCPGI
jgi:hypothetical protein